MNRVMSFVKKRFVEEISLKECVICGDMIFDNLFYISCICTKCQDDLIGARRILAREGKNIGTVIAMSKEQQKAYKLEQLLHKGHIEKLDEEVGELYASHIAKNYQIYKDIDCILPRPVSLEEILDKAHPYRDKIAETISKRLRLKNLSGIFAIAKGRYLISESANLKEKNVLMFDTILDLDRTKVHFKELTSFGIERLDVITLITI